MYVARPSRIFHYLPHRRPDTRRTCHFPERRSSENRVACRARFYHV